MKWLERIREKVSNSSLTSPLPRPNRLFLDEGTTTSRVREKNESEQDFKRAWDDFRAANFDKEKEEALEKTLSLFCKIARRNMWFFSWNIASYSKMVSSKWVVPNTLRFGAMDAVVESNPLCSVPISSSLFFLFFFKIIKFLNLPCKCPCLNLFK
ncbi:unnamed protein product [Sphagnum compactum]